MCVSAFHSLQQEDRVQRGSGLPGIGNGGIHPGAFSPLTQKSPTPAGKPCVQLGVEMGWRSLREDRASLLLLVFLLGHV